MIISFLGPEGTFTEAACIKYCNNSTRLPCATINDALSAVLSGEADKCVAPVENSIEGPVTSTVDAMVFDNELFIEKLIILPIEQNLLVKPGTIEQDIKTIVSHPQGLAQCRKYTRKIFPGAKEQIATSTAEAARLVSLSQGDMAAIGAQITADIYKLEIYKKSIQDSDNNRTSFIVVSKNKTVITKGETMSLAFSTKNKPGELFKIMNIFSLWDINMTKISSRPMRERPGEYVFMVDIEISNMNDVLDALTMVKKKVTFYKDLGCYSTCDYARLVNTN